MVKDGAIEESSSNYGNGTKAPRMRRALELVASGKKLNRAVFESGVPATS